MAAHLDFCLECNAVPSPHLCGKCIFFRWKEKNISKQIYRRSRHSLTSTSLKASWLYAQSVKIGHVSPSSFCFDFFLTRLVPTFIGRVHREHRVLLRKCFETILFKEKLRVLCALCMKQKPQSGNCCVSPHRTHR
jgi:hypothetical protein